ncbi:hypothetical protein [Bowmanella denitrificans]|uniref:hypothetical protein n=1 Tax=Bowmanella denitrificans TaxID=366582 RepID=UPI000C9A3ED3|nr:hypothetical protein [Bowmanella denitrificans]
MPVIKLNPGQELDIGTPAKFLSVINANGQFVIESPAFGKVAGKVGRQYVLENVGNVTFINPTDGILDIDYEIANIQIFGAGNGTVSIDNKPTIQRIEEAIQVEAQATVEDGKMRQIQPNVLAAINQQTIPAGAVRQFVPARDNTNRRVTIQVISEALTVLRIGADNTITQTQGAIVAGSLDAIGTAVLDTASAIWLRNTSDTDAIVTGMEEYRP